MLNVVFIAGVAAQLADVLAAAEEAVSAWLCRLQATRLQATLPTSYTRAYKLWILHQTPRPCLLPD